MKLPDLMKEDLKKILETEIPESNKKWHAELSVCIRLILSNSNDDKEKGVQQLAALHAKGLLLEHKEYYLIFFLGYCYEKEYIQNKLDFGANRKIAFDLYQIAANNGVAYAQSQLGDCYSMGKGMPQNETTAFYHYSLAAAQDHSIGQFNLGNCYRVGAGTPHDIDKAVEYYTKALNQGLGARAEEGLRDCAACYKWGQHTPKDMYKFIEVSQLANRSGLLKEISRTEDKAAKNDANAQFCLGVIYEKGNVVKTDLVKALHYYEAAKKNGHKLAVYCVQSFTLKKLATSSPALQERTFNHYLKLASDTSAEGTSAAHNALGFCYQFGVGTTIDAKKAVEHYEIAAKENHIMALTALGQCYQFGIGVKAENDKQIAENNKKAYEYYSQACPQGSEQAFPQARYSLEIWDRIQIARYGTEANKKLRLDTYSRDAAIQGYTSAINHLAVLCHHGLGMNGLPDFKAAFKLYRMAAKRGDADALCNLGACYYSGLGVGHFNTVEAYRCYLIAAKQQHIEAIQIVSDPYPNYGLDVTRSLITAYRNLEKEKIRLEELAVPKASIASTAASLSSAKSAQNSKTDVNLFKKSTMATYSIERKMHALESIIEVNGEVKLFFARLPVMFSVNSGSLLKLTAANAASTNTFMYMPNEMCDLITDYVGLLEQYNEGEILTIEPEANAEVNANTNMKPNTKKAKTASMVNSK